MAECFFPRIDPLTGQLHPMNVPDQEPAMTIASDSVPAAKRASRVRRWILRGMKAAAILLGVWLVLAYLILPAFWRHFEHNPGLADAPKTTLTAQGIPGDPLNVGLVGAEQQVVRAMLAAGWRPADAITFRSTLRIAASVVFKRPDPDAPVSALFLFGRRQDLAFEKPVGGNARRRHHVRFWRRLDDAHGAPLLWIGAATYDLSVGFSHRTGQVTHHIAPDIDAERHGVFEDLIAAGWVDRIYQVTGVGATLAGRNGGGDRYHTDGELTIGVLSADGGADRTPDRLPNPPAVVLKEQLWSAIGPLLRALDPET